MNYSTCMFVRNNNNNKKKNSANLNWIISMQNAQMIVCMPMWVSVCMLKLISLSNVILCLFLCFYKSNQNHTSVFVFSFSSSSSPSVKADTTMSKKPSSSVERQWQHLHFAHIASDRIRNHKSTNYMKLWNCWGTCGTKATNRWTLSMQIVAFLLDASVIFCVVISVTYPCLCSFSFSSGRIFSGSFCRRRFQRLHFRPPHCLRIDL